MRTCICGNLLRPRARVCDDCRAKKERERRAYTFSHQRFADAGKIYDPDLEGYGGPEQWEEIARLLFGGKPHHTGPQHVDRRLRILGLDAMPTSLADLKRAFRAAMMKAHPDMGGSNAAARDVLEAFAALKSRLE